jgi:DNA-directed RNA polymerase II subunit RPB1
LDAEKAKDGIEIPMDNGYMGVGGGGMFMAAGTPSMSPAMTPWDQTSTPVYQNSSWQSSKIFKILSSVFLIFSIVYYFI